MSEEFIDDKVAEGLLMTDYDDLVWGFEDGGEDYYKHDLNHVWAVYKHLPSGRYFKVAGISSYYEGLGYESYCEVEKSVYLKEVVTWK